MRPSFLLVLLPILAGCHDTASNQGKTAPSTFDKRMDCAQLASSGNWENLPDGPCKRHLHLRPEAGLSSRQRR